MGLFRSSEFASGTRILFQQSTAPVGWTKDATHNDKSLRVVSGTAGSGGSVAFSAFAAQSIGSTTLSTAQMPSHNHSYTASSNADAPSSAQANWSCGGGYLGQATGTMTSTGGGGSHTHSLNMSLQYVDAIICAKN